MEDEAGILHDLLQRHRPKHSVAWPKELRQRAGQHAVERHSRGESWTAIGESLGVNESTLRHWAKKPLLVSSSGTMVPVVVSESVEPGFHHSGARSGSGLVLISPRGFRVAGLTLEAAIEALEKLE